MSKRRASRRERRVVLLWIAFVMALGYRPASPWSGVIAGVVAVIELALFGMGWRTVARLADAKSVDSGQRPVHDR